MAGNGSRGVASIRRRHPRVIGWLELLQRRPVLVGGVAAVGIAVVLTLDIVLAGRVWAGFYLVPLTLLAVAMRPRVVAITGLGCLGLYLAVAGAQGALSLDTVFMATYAVLAGGGLTILSYLLRRVSTISAYAVARAQLAEAANDIIAGSHEREDMDHMLEYALERLGEQVDALSGILLLRDDGRLAGAAGFGVGRDARDVVVSADEVPLVAEAVSSGQGLRRDVSGRERELCGDLAGDLRLERLMVLPLVALERDVGVIILSRSRSGPDYGDEQVAFGEQVAHFVAVTVENVRLMVELSTRRQALELVRDSSLDFAQSLDLNEVLEAVVMRLVDSLAMDSCEIYEVDLERREMRVLVSYSADHFDAGDERDRVYALDRWASSALAVHTRREVIVTSPDDPRLNAEERDLFVRLGHRTQLSIPLRVRDRVLALVELFDNVDRRQVTAEELDLARTLCRFAALAVDKAQLFDRQRVTAENLDRLARRLQRLQAFSLDLNRALEWADPQEVMDQVAQAVVEVGGVRAAAVVGAEGGSVVLQAVAGDGADDGVRTQRLLERTLAALDPAVDDAIAGDDLATAGMTARDGLLVAPVETDVPLPVSALVAADKIDGRFDDEDSLLLATLAAQLGASLHNTLAYQREHAIAETFQTALLQEPPTVPGLQVGVCYQAATEAAKVGGDFYDLAPLGPGRLMVMVGDVCGKGLAAAAQSAVVRYMLRAYAADGSPGEALSRLNSTVVMQAPTQPFVTLVLAYVDVNRHMVQYACAGHPRPVVLAGGRVFPVPDAGGVPVGIFRGAVYETNRAVLPDDAVMVLHTDGLTEARHGREMYGEARLHEAIAAHGDRPADEIAAGLMASVAEYAGGILPDDCAVVVIRLP